MLNILITMLVPLISFCQARIVFNQAGMVMSNQAKLVIENPLPDALTVNTSGGITSEGANNNVLWNIGNVSTYVLPFVSDGTAIPVSFSTANSAGNGIMTFSTYAGPDWQNSNYLPPTVTNVNNDGTDNSNHVIDRFWQINAAGYTVNPSLTNLVFSYKENEWNEAGNTITESKLTAQNWNNSTNAWLPPVGTDNASANTVTVANVGGTQLYPWWTLVSSDNALPLILLNFTAEKINGNAALKWLVSSQVNVSFYEVQRSFDAINFVSVGKVVAIYNTNAIQNYSYTDALGSINAPVIYYRLRMVDNDGKFSYSGVRNILMSKDENNLIQISPNPVTNTALIRFGKVSDGSYLLSVFTADGRQVMIEKMVVTSNSTFYFHRNNLAAGTYFFRITGNGIKNQFTILIQ